MLDIFKNDLINICEINKLGNLYEFVFVQKMGNF